MTKPMKQPPIPTNPNQGAIPMTSNPGIISHTPSKRRDKATVVNAFVVLRGALAATPDASYDLPSGTITVPELTQEIDEYMAAVGAVEAARQAFHAAVEKEKQLRVKPTLHRAELKAVVAAHIGKHAVELARYGFAPEKVRVVSPQAKLLGAIKAQATRVARGTMGRRQKLAVRGNVTRVVITPVTRTVAPVPSALPGEAGGQGGGVSAGAEARSTSARSTSD